MDLKLKRRKEKIDKERKREGVREEEREKGGGGVREPKIERAILKNGEEIIVFNSFFTKIIIPTITDRDSRRER